MHTLFQQLLRKILEVIHLVGTQNLPKNTNTWPTYRQYFYNQNTAWFTIPINIQYSFKKLKFLFQTRI